MDRFDEINAFAAVADARSFTQGARRLGVSSAQVSKLVARLENETHVRERFREAVVARLETEANMQMDENFRVKFETQRERDED